MKLSAAYGSPDQQAKLSKHLHIFVVACKHITCAGHVQKCCTLYITTKQTKKNNLIFTAQQKKSCAEFPLVFCNCFLLQNVKEM